MASAGDASTRRLLADPDPTADVGVEVGPVIRHGNPAETIVSDATDEVVDLIVLGTKRRAEASRSFIGSVTHRVLGLTMLPALVVQTAVEP